MGHRILATAAKAAFNENSWCRCGSLRRTRMS